MTHQIAFSVTLPTIYYLSHFFFAMHVCNLFATFFKTPQKSTLACMLEKNPNFWTPYTVNPKDMRMRWQKS
jgi:hypothetical protein